MIYKSILEFSIKMMDDVYDTLYIFKKTLKLEN